MVLMFSAGEWNMNANFYLLLNFSLSPISVRDFFFFLYFRIPLCRVTDLKEGGLGKN